MGRKRNPRDVVENRAMPWLLFLFLAVRRIHGSFAAKVADGSGETGSCTSPSFLLDTWVLGFLSGQHLRNHVHRDRPDVPLKDPTSASEPSVKAFATLGRSFDWKEWKVDVHECGRHPLGEKKVGVTPYPLIKEHERLQPYPQPEEQGLGEGKNANWETHGIQDGEVRGAWNDERPLGNSTDPLGKSEAGLDTPPLVTKNGYTDQCYLRREWQPPCDWWSHEPHHRYLLYGPLGTREGVGGNLMRIAWAFNRAISFDLEVVFESPLNAGHDVGDIGTWFGITGNSLLAIEDPLQFSLAQHVEVPSWKLNETFSRQHEHSANWYDPTGETFWFYKRRKETSVVYIPHPKTLNKYRYFGRPAEPTSLKRGLCSHARYALQRVFWHAPHKRDRCRSVLHGIEPILDPAKSGGDPSTPRPWFIAMHIRRGDKTKSDHSEGKSVRFFNSMAQAVLQAVSRITPGAQVFFAVFSEGEVVDESKGGTGELQLIDDRGVPMNLDVPRDFCDELGLVCSQELVLVSPALETLECLATADVFIGDKSQFSEAAGALSTNVKTVHRSYEEDQYTVTVDKRVIMSEGQLGEEKTLEIYEAIRNWYKCFVEAWRLPDRSSSGEHRVYQTIDG